MKAKILLLSLATLLLGACQQDSEPMEAYLSIKKNREHGRKKRVCHERNGGDVTD